MNGKKYTEIKECRICGSKNLVSYLDLGDMPLVNRLIVEEEIPKEEKFPLEVLFCKDCFLSQLSVVVNPSVLFRNYVYRSSISDSFKKHCKELAEELNENILKKGELVMDIASNDGCLLVPFKERMNKVLGIDPAINLAKIANESGIETIPEFWDESLAKKILEKYGPAKIITAFNVFAHVNDIHSFVKGVKILLSRDGYFIIEVPHLYNLIRKTEFDTVYHEHLSYILVKPIERLIHQHGMRIAKVKKFDIHGGSIRLYIENKDKLDTSDGSTQEVIQEEEKSGLYDINTYMNLRKDVDILKKNLISKIQELKKQGNTIFAFGASAKGNILLNYCGIDKTSINYIFDDTPEKQGKLAPGIHIPIIPGKDLLKKKPDYLLLLCWNFAEEVMSKTKDYKEQGGKYILPVPNLKII
ncbi:methyltransferase [archaeon]|nr:methyltransferase [archaeon]|tara:strand:+ start:529 stop:1770 length:1242 start_codon:yes stop_codon:yes gene_type:complete